MLSPSDDCSCAVPSGVRFHDVILTPRMGVFCTRYAYRSKLLMCVT